MRKAAWQIALLAGILLVVFAACRLAMRNTYTAYIPVQRATAELPGELRLEPETPGIVAPGQPEGHEGYVRVPIRAQQPGDTWLELRAGDEALNLNHLRVSRFGTVYDYSTGGFTGDTVALAAFTAFCLAVAAIMFRTYRAARGPAFYAYTTIYAVGFGLFALLTGLTMLIVTLRHALRPYAFSMLSAYSAVSGASFQFLMVTAPAMLVFAVALAVSNVALLRHEPFAPKNALAIGVSLLLLAGEALAAWLYTRDFSGSDRAWRITNTLQNVYATAFAYFECVLIGAVICGVRAARHVPEPGVDYILILGCRFRRDGTLTPLLQGRVDRAIDFWQAQRRATGREAALVPSGGRGPDECMPEAEAMRRYLLAKGVPERAIRVEAESRNTYQNMAYSKALIDGERPGAKVAYVTTNYHVFRSGVWAARAGLSAEGMGSRTKWWYWPNAFMRECAGLLLNRIPQELLLLAAMIALFGALSVALQ